MPPLIRHINTYCDEIIVSLSLPFDNNEKERDVNQKIDEKLVMMNFHVRGRTDLNTSKQTKWFCKHFTTPSELIFSIQCQWNQFATNADFSFDRVLFFISMCVRSVFLFR